MKKSIIFTLIFILCGSFCFAGCSKVPENFWKNTSTNLTTFFNGAEYNEPSITDFGVIYQFMLRDTEGLYKELLTYYVPLYKASIFCSKQYAQVFDYTPNNQKKLYKKMQNVDKNLEQFKEQLKLYNQAKRIFLQQVDVSSADKAYSSTEKNRLLKFKGNFIELIESAITLSGSVSQAYSLGYYDFAPFAEMGEEEFNETLKRANRELALNVVNIELAKSATTILTVFNENGIPYDYIKYWSTATDFFTFMETYYAQPDLTYPTDLKEKFIVWKGIYDQYLKDNAKFNKIVGDINFKLLKRCNNDPLSYAKETGNDRDLQKVNFYLDFHNSTQILSASTKNLF